MHVREKWLNSNLTNGILVDYYNLSTSATEIAAGVLVTTSKNLHSTLNSRKFSDYGYLCFELLINDNSVRDTKIIPVNRFITQKYTAELIYVDSANVQRWVTVIYASDTSYYVQGSSNIVTNTKVHITGMKACF